MLAVCCSWPKACCYGEADTEDGTCRGLSLRRYGVERKCLSAMDLQLPSVLNYGVWHSDHNHCVGFNAGFLFCIFLQCKNVTALLIAPQESIAYNSHSAINTRPTKRLNRSMDVLLYITESLIN